MKDKYIIYFISRTKANMIKFIENKLKENDLAELIPTHGNILTALYESDKKLTMKEIAQKIGKDKSTVTPLVNKLIRLGYIEKEKSSTDKRVTYISLTSKARDIEDRFNFISSQVKETAYKDFTKEEKEEFLRLLRKLNSNFKNENLKFEK
ncbi:MAG: MarR family winged helix-turn-helix transcriptional regulator [Clostridium sp.]|nr:MarR family transcriptional regulator [uncultured Terrisporobacter sp.]